VLAYLRRTTVKIPDALDARLRHEAERRGVTISQVSREALEAYLVGLPARRWLGAAAAGRSAADGPGPTYPTGPFVRVALTGLGLAGVGAGWLLMSQLLRMPSRGHRRREDRLHAVDPGQAAQEPEGHEASPVRPRRRPHVRQAVRHA
jgi:hypothetical protein